MKKIRLFFSISLGFINLAYAGRGAFLIVDNATTYPVLLKATAAKCIDHVADINGQVESVHATKIYLEANSRNCDINSAQGEFSIYTLDEQLIATAAYSFKHKSTQAELVSSQANPNYIIKVTSLNTTALWAGRSDQDLIVVNITPAGPTSQLYAGWMWKFHSQLAHKTLAQLVIPGTHDSLTYALNPKTLCAADADARAVDLNSYGLNFSQAQLLDFNQQLNQGIRYFDIRLCFQSATDYITHSFISNQTFDTNLQQLATFLTEQPQEIVILDLQHVFGYNQERLADLLDKIKLIFGQKLIGFDRFNPNSSLSSIWQSNPDGSSPNLILILPDSVEANNLLVKPQYRFAWPRSSISSPWPNAQNLTDLLAKNTQYLINRSKNTLFVNQLQLTPDSNYILKHLGYSLESMSYRNLSAIYAWQWQQILSPNLNIFIRDWSDGYDGAIFAIIANLAN